MMVRVLIQKEKDTKMPGYAYKGDAGADLYAAEEYVLRPMQRALISTGVRISIPEGYEAQIRPRSGLAINHGISMVNAPGTIDSTFRGELKVILINFGDQDFNVKKGDRIAQMILNKVEKFEFEEVSVLDETERNENGYGSTGTR